MLNFDKVRDTGKLDYSKIEFSRCEQCETATKNRIIDRRASRTFVFLSNQPTESTDRIYHFVRDTNSRRNEALKLNDFSNVFLYIYILYISLFLVNAYSSNVAVRFHLNRSIRRRLGVQKKLWPRRTPLFIDSIIAPKYLSHY